MTDFCAKHPSIAYLKTDRMEVQCKTEAKENNSGVKVRKLPLDSCDFELATLEGGKNKLTFKEREFIADHILFRQQDDGRCLVELHNELNEQR